MRTLLLTLAAVGALAVAGTASAGGWATAGVSPPPDDPTAGSTWDAKITILQHGQTPLVGDLADDLADRRGRPARDLPDRGRPTSRASTWPRSSSRPPARGRTRSTTASASTAAPRRTPSARSRWAAGSGGSGFDLPVAAADGWHPAGARRRDRARTGDAARCGRGRHRSSSRDETGGARVLALPPVSPVRVLKLRFFCLSLANTPSWGDPRAFKQPN